VNETASLVACYLQESPYSSAAAYADGRIEKHLSFSFSAARRTWSPKLSDQENEKLFGAAASPKGHGHEYRVRVTLDGKIEEKIGTHVPYSEVNETIEQLRNQLDHTNLTEQLSEFKTEPNTTESLALILYRRLKSRLPVNRVRVHEHEHFYAECRGGDQFTMGVTTHFFAAHRLNAKSLNAVENRELYGKCNNPAGHGHEYVIECALDGKLDEMNGTLFPLPKFEQLLQGVVADWNYKHLDAEIPYFADHPSTGENILHGLWEKGKAAFGREPFRMRLWETPNNRFTIRRETPGA
jgi:6-pyruvoyltetrahydropterin/6-carboxytetrahydropterin synthase